MDYSVYVISAGRPDAVARMAPHLSTLDVPAWWVTPEHDRPAYEEAGAVVIPVEEAHLTRQRNAALDDAFANGRSCVQLDDDLKRLRRLPMPGTEITLGVAMWHLEAALKETGLALAGNSPTDNLYFAQEGVSTRKFVPTPCIMVRPTELRFDENLRLKEDYDFTLQHWATHGGAARCDYIAPSFGRYTNAGGAVSYRTPELEQETIAYLHAKWPGMLRDNPRRPNEILLRTPRRTR